MEVIRRLLSTQSAFNKYCKLIINQHNEQHFQTKQYTIKANENIYDKDIIIPIISEDFVDQDSDDRRFIEKVDEMTNKLALKEYKQFVYDQLVLYYLSGDDTVSLDSKYTGLPFDIEVQIR